MAPGKLGEPKIAGLLETGARIHVVALQASPAVQDWAREGKIELELRAFSPQDLAGAFLAIVATNSRTLNERVYREAQARGCCAMWSTFPISATSFIPQWFVVAICKSQFRPRDRAHRWHRKFASSLKNNSAQDTPPGSRNWAKPESSFSPATSTKKRKLDLLHSLASREALEAALAELPELAAKGEGA